MVVGYLFSAEVEMLNIKEILVMRKDATILLADRNSVEGIVVQI